MKAKIDEAITDHMINQKQAKQNNTFSNVKITLAAIGTMATLYAYGFEYLYDKPFP